MTTGVSPSAGVIMAHTDWVATGAMACNSAVVWLQPRGPPNSSRTRWVNPRPMERPTNSP